MKEQINSKRLDFAPGEVEWTTQSIQIKYKPDDEALDLRMFVNEDGSITFKAAGASDEAEEEEDDAGYFPSNSNMEGGIFEPYTC